MHAFDEDAWWEVRDLGFGAHCIVDQCGPHEDMTIGASKIEYLVTVIDDLRKAIEATNARLDKLG